MSPARRAFFAHLLAYPFGVVCAYLVMQIGAGFLLSSEPLLIQRASLVLAGCGAGLATYSLILGRALSFTVSGRWWITGMGALCAACIGYVGFVSSGWLAPAEALVVVLVVMFAVGAWAASQKVAQ